MLTGVGEVALNNCAILGDSPIWYILTGKNVSIKMAEDKNLVNTHGMFAIYQHNLNWGINIHKRNLVFKLVTNVDRVLTTKINRGSTFH